MLRKTNINQLGQRARFQSSNLFFHKIPFAMNVPTTGRNHLLCVLALFRSERWKFKFPKNPSSSECTLPQLPLPLATTRSSSPSFPDNSSGHNERIDEEDHVVDLHQ
mmetsp:Transcript_6659/g.16380  ORF Transcript_6659/g.16380 Transcript_6659/m.16380 type:complete len:107 (-) Transcript_6659:1133-1453(-)